LKGKLIFAESLPTKSPQNTENIYMDNYMYHNLTEKELYDKLKGNMLPLRAFVSKKSLLTAAAVSNYSWVTDLYTNGKRVANKIE